MPCVPCFLECIVVENSPKNRNRTKIASQCAWNYNPPSVDHYGEKLTKNVIIAFWLRLFYGKIDYYLTLNFSPHSICDINKTDMKTKKTSHLPLKKSLIRRCFPAHISSPLPQITYNDSLPLRH